MQINISRIYLWYYMTKAFESAENRIELELDCDIDRVEVK